MEKKHPQEQHFGPVWFIPGPNQGKYPFCHSIYIEGPGILIDPASDRERLAQLRDDPGVNMVWLSHAHEDHFMHLDLFEGIPLWVAEADAPPLASVEALMAAYGVEDRFVEDWRTFFKDVIRFKPMKPEHFLEPGERYTLGGVAIDILAAPGHTPGNLAFYFPEPDILFLADYDLTNFGPWYGDVGSDIDTTITSVRQLQKMQAGICLASHEDGVFTETPPDLWDRYLAVIDRRENDLLAFLETPATITDIVKKAIIYGRRREPAAFFEFGERAMMEKHLERLRKKGVVVQDGTYYQRVQG